MSVDYKAIAIGIVYVPIVWILQVLPLHDYLNYFVQRFSAIAYATGRDEPIDSVYNLFLLTLVIMFYVKVVLAMKRDNQILIWYGWILTGLMDIVAVPLGILIMVYYYNLFPPRGFGIPHITEAAPGLALVALYYFKEIATLYWIVKDKKRSQIGQVSAIE